VGGIFWLLGAAAGVAAFVVGAAARRQGAGSEAIVAIVLGVLAAIMPARRAAKLNPLESISSELPGPVCRVAGEIEESIFQGYANKRHHGVAGHAIIGAWTNLGALTTPSHLKNNYGTVRVSIGGRVHDTGESKVGAFIGDHVKTAIGTLLTTGAVVGPAANLVGGATTSPKELPAFAWWDGTSVAAYDVEKFVATARIVCSRRSQTFGEAQEALYRGIAG